MKLKHSQLEVWIANIAFQFPFPFISVHAANLELGVQSKSTWLSNFNLVPFNMKIAMAILALIAAVIASGAAQGLFLRKYPFCHFKLLRLILIFQIIIMDMDYVNEPSVGNMENFSGIRNGN